MSLIKIVFPVKERLCIKSKSGYTRKPRYKSINSILSVKSNPLVKRFLLVKSTLLIKRLPQNMAVFFYAAEKTAIFFYAAEK